MACPDGRAQKDLIKGGDHTLLERLAGVAAEQS